MGLSRFEAGITGILFGAVLKGSQEEAKALSLGVGRVVWTLNGSVDGRLPFYSFTVLRVHDSQFPIREQ